jgi:hypothetical protein
LIADRAPQLKAGVRRRYKQHRRSRHSKTFSHGFDVSADLPPKMLVLAKLRLSRESLPPVGR